MPANPAYTRAIAKQEELRLDRVEGADLLSRPPASDEDEVIARAERRRRIREEARRAADSPVPGDRR